MARKAGLVALVGVIVTMAAAQQASAAQCGFADLVSAYKSGVERGERGDKAGERKVMMILAEGGFPLAARNFAEDLASGQGGDKDRIAAARWASLAALANDEIAMSLRRYIGWDDSVANWRPRRLVCDEPGMPRLADDEEAIPEFRHVVEWAPGLSDEAKAAAETKLPGLLDAVRSLHPMASTYLSLLAKVRIVRGDRYDRYIGWQHGSGGGVLRIAIGNFLDNEVQYAAGALLAEIARHVYDAVGDTHYSDEFLEIHQLADKNIRVYGTAYLDNSNVPFFRMTKQAFHMIEKLPLELRQLAKTVDEIRYNPISSHFKKFGTLDVVAAYYNRSLSSEGHRIIFIRRKATYLSPLYFVRSLIHEGTHIKQDERAASFAKDLPKLKGDLAILQKAGRGASVEAKALGATVEAREDYVTRWYQGTEGEVGRIQDIRFECEATVNEIKAVRLLDALPSAMDDSGYLKLCPDAQKLMVEWQDSRLKANGR